MAQTTMEITVMSYIFVTPEPMLVKISLTGMVPVYRPTTMDRMVPTPRTAKTLKPMRAPMRTTR